MAQGCCCWHAGALRDKATLVVMCTGDGRPAQLVIVGRRSDSCREHDSTPPTAKRAAEQRGERERQGESERPRRCDCTLQSSCGSGSSSILVRPRDHPTGSDAPERRRSLRCAKSERPRR